MSGVDKTVDEVMDNLYVPKKELPDFKDAKDFYYKNKDDGLWHFDFWWRKK